jgi:hypothetical protein
LIDESIFDRSLDTGKGARTRDRAEGARRARISSVELTFAPPHTEPRASRVGRRARARHVARERSRRSRGGRRARPRRVVEGRVVERARDADPKEGESQARRRVSTRRV